MIGFEHLIQSELTTPTSYLDYTLLHKLVQHQRYSSLLFGQSCLRGIERL